MPQVATCTAQVMLPFNTLLHAGCTPRKVYWSDAKGSRKEGKEAEAKLLLWSTAAAL